MNHELILEFPNNKIKGKFTLMNFIIEFDINGLVMGELII